MLHLNQSERRYTSCISICMVVSSCIIIYTMSTSGYDCRALSTKTYSTLNISDRPNLMLSNVA